MDVTVIPHRGGGPTVIALRGQLDIDTAARLSGALDRVLTQPVPRVVVDLAGLTFCDSIGLSALATAYNRCIHSGGFLRLASPSPFLLKVLTVVGLTPTLPVYRTLVGACADDEADRLLAVAAGPERGPAGPERSGPADRP